MNDSIVCKFGGTSVATAERIENLIDIIRADGRRKYLVVSAPGKAKGRDTKVTDLLIKSLDDPKYFEQVKGIFYEIAEGLGVGREVIEPHLGELEKRLNDNHDGDRAKRRDAVVSGGEYVNAPLIAAALNKKGIKAHFVNPKDSGLVVTAEYGNSMPIIDSYKALGEKLKKFDGVVVFPGFYGYTKDGNIATFSRGGSDLTGAVVANAVDALEYENFTDVDGIRSADPRLVDDPAQIPCLTYKEMRELSYRGFNVFHDKAARPTMEKCIPIRVRNANNLSNSGTLILSTRMPNGNPAVGIASGKNYCSVTVEKAYCNEEVGFGERLLSVIKKHNLNYTHTPTGVDDISVILNQKPFEDDNTKMNSLIRSINDELSPDNVTTQYNLALLAVVGEGLRDKIGVANRITGALSRSGVNIVTIDQGSSQRSVSFGINSRDEKTAVNALYSEFFKN